MNRILLTLIIMVMSSAAMSSELFSKLSAQDKLMQLTFIVITCVDWAQTKEFRANGRPEENIVLGRYPSQSRVDNMILLGMISHTIAVWAIPSSWRLPVQAFSIASEIGAVVNNYRVGVKVVQVSFNF